MGEAQITNPNNAFGVTDGEQNNWRQTMPVLADGAIVAGDVVAITAQATDTAIEVHAADTDNDDPAMCKWVALEAIADGGVGLVVVKGYALVNIGSDTPAAGERLSATTTAGVAASTAVDATAIVGDSFATAIGAEIGTSNQCACWVD